MGKKGVFSVDKVTGLIDGNFPEMKVVFGEFIEKIVHKNSDIMLCKIVDCATQTYTSLSLPSLSFSLNIYIYMCI